MFKDVGIDVKLRIGMREAGRYRMDKALHKII